MRQWLVSLLVVVLLFSGTLCQSVSSNDFVPYRGCLTNPARNYFRPGTVVGEYFDEESGRKVYIFQPDDEPTDGQHLLRVDFVKRPCGIADLWTPPGNAVAPRDQ